jgi:hypothetical protein
VTNIDTNISSTTKTNEAGLYMFTSLKPGNYRLTVENPGFHQLVKTGIVLHVQDSLSENFNLQVGSVNESITVTADALNVNTLDASVSTVVDRQFVQNMPLNGRSFQSLILLSPGVVAVPGAFVGGQGEFSVNGQRTEANYYTVDGVSANVGQYNIWQVGATPAETALGTTQSMVSVDALQEFRISTSTYSAEYGRMPGAQISMQTRSGTNAWHGSLFEYLRNDVLDANNWFNNAAALPKTAERQNDFGGTIGGPIQIPGIYNGKDKTFFFFSYEGLRLTVPQPAFTNVVPDIALRQNAPAALRPLLNAFPVPNGPNQGDGTALFTSSYSTPSSLDAYGIRVDHSFGDKLRLFGRYADTPSNSLSRNPGSNFASLTNQTGDVKSLTIGATSLLWSRLANEFRFNYTKNSSSALYSQDNFAGATPLTFAQVMPGISVPKYTYFATYFFIGGQALKTFLGTSATPSDQWNITDSMTRTFGSHTLKFGVDYRRQSGLEGAIQLDNYFEYFSVDSILANAADYAGAYTASSTPASGYFTNFAAFVQDEWKATNRLHFSLGLRWDVNPAPTSNLQLHALTQVTNLATANAAPAGTPLYQTDYRGFAPRFGVVYQLHQSPGHDTVIRGGFGVFYDVGSNNALLGAGMGYGASTALFGAAFPLTPAQQALPAPTFGPPYDSFSAPDPHLKLPYTLEWNAAIEQQLGNNQKLTVSYVAAAGRRLLQSYFTSVSGNPNFNPDYAYLMLVANTGSSNYNSLQVQFQRRLSRGLQALASYTWSHAIDDLSYNGNWSNGVGTYSGLRRGNADFDVRHQFSAALTYDVPGRYANPFAGALLKHWSIDLRETARSALPVDISYGYGALPTGQMVSAYPDFVKGVPIYLSDPTAPGGRVINANAFAAPAGPTGNAPRNFVRGFPAVQTDLAIRREFPIHERLKLQFRGEFFNLFNQPNFSQIDTSVTDPLFGRSQSTLNNSLGGLNSLYQMGGPRSVQLSLRLNF